MTSTNPTDKDVTILSFFFENDNKPTHAAGIAKSGKISKRWSGERCKYLESVGVLSYKKEKPFRQKGETEYYFISPTIVALRVIVSALARDDLHKLMESPFYIDMIPLLCDHFLKNLHAAGMPKLTEDAAECLKLVLRCSESCLLFVLNKTPSELKNVFKGIEDHNVQRKKSVSYHVSEILKNPESVSKIRDWVRHVAPMPRQNAAAIKRVIAPHVIESIAVDVINSVIARPPTWEMLFYDMINRDQAFYDFWWSPEDENAVTRRVLNSSNPFSLTP